MDRERRSDPQRGPSPASFRRGIPLALLAFLALSCGGTSRGPESAPARGESGIFEGTGSSSGRAQTLLLGQGRYVAIMTLNGSLILNGDRLLGHGFRSETIGFTDSLKGGKAWSVWTDSRGDKVFSEVQGGAVGTGIRFTGSLLGGTGSYSGLTGQYEFEWQYVVRAEDGTIHGRSVGLRGRFRREAPPSPRRTSFLETDGDANVSD